jgi:hypothetical protein
VSIDWSRIVSIEDLRRLARRHVPHPLFGFIDGGAEDEVSLADNRAAYDRWKFRQRVFVDVSEIDTEVDLFGKPIRAPLLGHRRWLWQIATHGVPQIENLAGWPVANVGTQTLAAMAASQFDSALDWVRDLDAGIMQRA